MFQKCNKLETINTSNCVSMRYLFKNCISLIYFDLSSFDFSNIISIEEMFYNFENLKNIYFNDNININSYKLKNMR